MGHPRGTRGGGRFTLTSGLVNITEVSVHDQTFHENFEEEETEFNPGRHSTQREGETVVENVNSDPPSQLETRFSARSSRRDLNKSIPAAVIGGLLGLEGDELNDSQVWTRIVKAIRESQTNRSRAREGDGEVMTQTQPQTQVAHEPRPLGEPITLQEAPPQPEIPTQNEIRPQSQSRDLIETRVAVPLIRERESETQMSRGQSRDRDCVEIPVEKERDGGYDYIPFQEVGMALAGCDSQFAPKGSKAKILKHMELPNHGGLPPTDLMVFLEKLAEYATTDGYSEEFRTQIVPGTLEKAAKDRWVYESEIEMEELREYRRRFEEDERKWKEQEELRW